MVSSAAAADAMETGRRRASARRLRQALTGYLFLLPSGVNFLVFTAVPVVAALLMSLYQWNSIDAPKWVGLANYAQLILHDQLFHQVFLNTAIYVFGTVPVRVALSLLLAVALNQKLRGITFLRTMYFLPLVSSTVAVSLVWAWIYNPSFGLLNSVLYDLGVNNPPHWLASTTWALPAVMIMTIWQGLGFSMLIYLAGLQGIPQNLYEAAAIDGASPWRRLLNITVPLLSPTTFFVVVISIIGSFQVFDQVYVMTQGGPANATNTIVYYIYENAFEWLHMGYAAAVAWLLFLIILVFTLLQWRLQREWVYYE